MDLEARLQQKIDAKTKPPGSLGQLEAIALRVGLIQRTTEPRLDRPTILVFAGDHGIARHGVSPYPQEVTAQMVRNFLSGGAAINVFCNVNDIALRVVDAGVAVEFNATDYNSGLIDAKIARGTNDMLAGPAMSGEQCVAAIERGRELVRAESAAGSNLIGFGEMGIGNTSSAALLMSVYCDLPVNECAGRGTGLDDAGLAHKVEILSRAREAHAEVAAKGDPRDVLATFGGFEIAMIAGGMLEAARLGMVILVDGFVATSALLAARAIEPSVLANCIFAHASEENGHRAMLEQLGAQPLLDLGLRLGEGTGTALALPLLRAAVAFLTSMASFASAGVSDRGDA